MRRFVSLIATVALGLAGLPIVGVSQALAITAPPAPMLSTLSASSTFVKAAPGTAISPVALTAVGFTPTAISVAAGSSLPAGLSVGTDPSGQWVISGTPVQDGATSTTITATDATTSASVTVDFRISRPCSAITPNGAGTTANPYLISDKAELNWLRQTPSAWKGSSVQTADIDMSGCVWATGLGEPSRFFTGSFDGNGFVISGLTHSSSFTAGFVDYAQSAHLQSITLVNVDITGTKAAGGLIGSSYGATRVKASSVSGSVKGDRAGGLIGEMNVGTGQVVNGFATASVSGGSYAGGLVGVQMAGEIVNSYAVGSVAKYRSATTTTGPIVGGRVAAATIINDTVWNPTESGLSGAQVGVQRTAAQMRQFDTYASLGWKIATGWSPFLPWAICAGVNDGLPFHSKRFVANPCASLNMSTPILLATAGLTIAPVSAKATNYTPTTYAITDGTLPKGLSLNPNSGVIAGTPKTKAPLQKVTITGTQGTVSASEVLEIRVAASQSPSSDFGNCDTKQTTTGLVVTCTKPGTQVITPPAGMKLNALEINGADGSRVDTTQESVGANVILTNLIGASQAATSPSAYQVTVGSRGVMTTTTFIWSPPAHEYGGGGLSAVQSADDKGQATGLIAAAGGGGGGYTGKDLLQYLCAPTQLQHANQQADWCKSPRQLAAYSAGTPWVGSAGYPENTAMLSPPISTAWPDLANGSTGYVNPQLGGLPGTSFVAQGAVVTPRPSAGGGVDAARNGNVVMTFIKSTGSDFTGALTNCNITSPKIGDVVLCQRVSADFKDPNAVVKVPADALVARVEAAGAGGGAGGTAAGAWLDGGDGGAVHVNVDVSAVNSLEAQVGAGGEPHAYSTTWVPPFTWYGSGGGATSVVTDDGQRFVMAGGGGGANGFSADYSQVPTADRAWWQTWVGWSVPGQSKAFPNVTPWPVPATSVAQGSNAGLEGQSWWATNLVSGPSFESGKGGYGGMVLVDASGTAVPRAADDGFVMIRFCSLPGAPTVDSVTPGTSAGQATVDVVASAPRNDGGCATDAYEFRTSPTGAWVSAPAVSFSIVQNLVSGQSVCVQMRAHNDAGWSMAGENTCGNARSASADTNSGGGGGGNLGTTVTFAADGSVTPAAITVGIGGTFYINNLLTTAPNNAYVRDGNGGATGDIHSTTALCTSSTVSVCYLTNGINGPFTVDALGGIYIYNPTAMQGGSIQLN